MLSKGKHNEHLHLCVTLSRVEVCVDILAQSETMVPVLYNPAFGFASGEPCPGARVCVM